MAYPGRVRQRPNTGKCVLDVVRRELRFWEQTAAAVRSRYSISSLEGAVLPGSPVSGTSVVPTRTWSFHGRHKDGTSVGGFGVQCSRGGTGKAGQNDVRSSDPPNHWLAGTNGRSLADAIRPRPGGVDDPAGIDAFVFSGGAIAQKDSTSAALANVNGEHLAVVANDSSGFGSFAHPLGGQTFRETRTARPRS